MTSTDLSIGDIVMVMAEHSDAFQPGAISMLPSVFIITSDVFD